MIERRCGMSIEEMGYFTDRAVRSDRIIYTPTLFAKEALLYLQEVGSLQALKPHQSHRESLDSFLFFVVKNGRGELQFRGQKYSLSVGDCVFIDCRHPYYHRSSKDAPWSLKWMHFNGSMAATIYDKYLSRGGENVFPSNRIDQYMDVIDAVYRVADSEDYIRDMRINGYLQNFLTLLMEETYHPEQEIGGAKQESIHLVKEYLESHYEDKVTLDDLSQRFYINKYYLTKLFKQTYGVTVNSYLLQIGITRAKQLLRFTDLSVEMIGEKCGISDPNYFNRAFKKIEGLTPRRYRMMW